MASLSSRTAPSSPEMPSEMASGCSSRARHHSVLQQSFTATGSSAEPTESCMPRRSPSGAARGTPRTTRSLSTVVLLGSSATTSREIPHASQLTGRDAGLSGAQASLCGLTREESPHSETVADWRKASRRWARRLLTHGIRPRCSTFAMARESGHCRSRDDIEPVLRPKRGLPC